jgi:hypothetical protein
MLIVIFRVGLSFGAEPLRYQPYSFQVFEPNKNKIPIRIAEAERRIAARTRELFNSGNHDSLECSALNVALYALFALKCSLDWNVNERDLSNSAVA